METQIKKLENHLIKCGRITSWEAIMMYRITRLSALIFVLKEKGWIIDDVWKMNKNTNTRYKEYILVSEPKKFDDAK